MLLTFLVSGAQDTCPAKLVLLRGRQGKGKRGVSGEFLESALRPPEEVPDLLDQSRNRLDSLSELLDQNDAVDKDAVCSIVVRHVFMQLGLEFFESRKQTPALIFREDGRTRDFRSELANEILYALHIPVG